MSRKPHKFYFLGDNFWPRASRRGPDRKCPKCGKYVSRDKTKQWILDGRMYHEWCLPKCTHTVGA